MVSYIGLIKDERLAMIVEFVPNGSVEVYYRKNKIKNKILGKFALDTCRGMVILILKHFFLKQYNSGKKNVFKEI